MVRGDWLPFGELLERAELTLGWGQRRPEAVRTLPRFWKHRVAADSRWPVR